MSKGASFWVRTSLASLKELTLYRFKVWREISISSIVLLLLAINVVHHTTSSLILVLARRSYPCRSKLLGFLRNRCARITQLGLTMCKVTFIAHLTVSSSFIVAAKLRFIFLVNLIHLLFILWDILVVWHLIINHIHLLLLGLYISLLLVRLLIISWLHRIVRLHGCSVSLFTYNMDLCYSGSLNTTLTN